MRNTKIASRYAKALLDLVLEKQLLEKARDNMQVLANVCKSNKDFRKMLESPVIRSDKKMSVLKVLFGESFDPAIMGFLLILTSKRREMYLGIIADEFIKIYKEYLGIKTARLITAVPADEALTKKIIKILEDYTKKKIELTEEVDESIIGGFVLQVDDYQYDTSLVNELNKLRKEFRENIYEKGF
jgi:F-type H+-transporting ATPase subunit delta